MCAVFSSRLHPILRPCRLPPLGQVGGGGFQKRGEGGMGGVLQHLSDSRQPSFSPLLVSSSSFVSFFFKFPSLLQRFLQFKRFRPYLLSSFGSPSSSYTLLLVHHSSFLLDWPPLFHPFCPCFFTPPMLSLFYVDMSSASMWWRSVLSRVSRCTYSVSPPCQTPVIIHHFMAMTPFVVDVSVLYFL